MPQYQWEEVGALKVINVEPIVLVAPLKVTRLVSTGLMTHTYATLVRVHTDEGITGIGECLARNSPEAAAAIVEKILKPLVVGQDPFNVELIWDKMYSSMRVRGHSKGFMLEAISGVDMALWDVMGKSLGEPVHRLLGSYGRTRLQAYASSLSFKPVAVLIQEAETLIAQGFTGIKLKVGQGPEIDGLNARELRKALGDGVKIMTDANCGFDTLTALEVGKRLQAAGVYWFEEPVPPDNVDGYVKLANSLDMPVAGGESEFNRWAFKELFVRNALDIVQPDLGRCGGFTEGRRIAALASAFDVPVAPHTGASSAVSVAAALQWSAALPNLLTYEHMYTANTLREELLAEPLPPVKDGYVDVPQKPGLGIELDEQVVARFRVG